MKLIKTTRSERSKTGKKSRQRYGLFFCPYCKKEVEKQISCGRKAKSCGCYRGRLIAKSNVKLKTKHGYKGTRLYNVWATIKGRCLCKSNSAYHYYGAKGITVCEEWKNSFVAFKDWALQSGYKDTLQIDRINNNGNYTPENCRFVTNAENARNSSNTKLNWNIVKKIRKLYSFGIQQNKIAESFSLSKQTVNDVVLRKRWNE